MSPQTCLWLAGNEGMEKKLETTIMGYLGMAKKMEIILMVI